MKKRYKFYLLAAGLAAGLLTGCGGKNPDEKKAEEPQRQEEERMSEEEDGTSFPMLALEESEEPSSIAFEAPDLEGKMVSSDIFEQSKLTMVNVWATYCGPCLNEMPGLGELAKEYDLSEFQIVGIISDVMEGASQADLEQAQELVERTGADYPHLLLNLSLYDALLTDVTVVPTTFFIDADGRLLDTVIGSMEKSDWEEKIDALLEDL